jgi:Ser/Thr protein kinase RdoA (MazF antagonist)
VATRALTSYDLKYASLEFIAHGENTTFRVTGPDGARYLLRVHRPNRHGRAVDSRQAVQSELEWLAALRTDTTLAVPEPVRSITGELTTTETTDDIDEPRVCSLLRWMDGRNHSRSARPIHLRRIGAVLAQLHNHADHWHVPDRFVRIRWDHAAYFGNTMVYGNVDAADVWTLLPLELRDVCARVADDVGAVMLTLGDGANVFGLVHADAHLDNVLFSGQQACLIDFDDCGFGYRIYDAAVALWELRHRSDYEEFQMAFVYGYTQHRPLPNEQLEHLDLFIAAREVAFALWLVGMAQTRESFRAVLAAELAHIERSLSLVLNDAERGVPREP